MIGEIAIGIPGSVIGGWVGQALGFYAPGEPALFPMPVLGGIVLLFGYRRVASKA